MSWWAWAWIGAVAASCVWLFAIVRLIAIIAAQRERLSQVQASLRFHRETRDHSDQQVRALLDQNERLARQLIDRAAEATPTPVITVPQSFFQSRRES